MHEYYEKNRKRLKKTMKGFLALLREELEGVSGKPYDTVLEEIWKIYEHDMLDRFPYIGGDGASGTKNLTEAYMLVAMGEFLKDYDMTVERI